MLESKYTTKAQLTLCVSRYKTLQELKSMVLAGSTTLSESHSVVSDSATPWTIHSPWNSPGQNTGVF